MSHFLIVMTNQTKSLTIRKPIGDQLIFTKINLVWHKVTSKEYPVKIDLTNQQ